MIFKSAKCRPHAQLCSHFVKMICFKNQLVECITDRHKYSVTNTPAREDHGKNHAVRPVTVAITAGAQAAPAIVGQLHHQGMQWELSLHIPAWSIQSNSDSWCPLQCMCLLLKVWFKNQQCQHHSRAWQTGRILTFFFNLHLMIYLYQFWEK